MNSQKRAGEQQIQRSGDGTVFHNIQEIKNKEKDKEKSPAQGLLQTEPQHVGVFSSL